MFCAAGYAFGHDCAKLRIRKIGKAKRARLGSECLFPAACCRITHDATAFGNHDVQKRIESKKAMDTAELFLYLFSRAKRKSERRLIVLFCVGDIVIRRGRLTLEPTSANVEPADHVSGVSHHHRL
jgi:hypothetical protein